jgi:hypothetical protein
VLLVTLLKAAIPHNNLAVILPNKVAILLKVSADQSVGIPLFSKYLRNRFIYCALFGQH